jgi:hypothetical protein
LLDADNLRVLLDKLLPAKNRDVHESYSDLLTELAKFEVKKVGDLEKILLKQRDYLAKQEAENVERAAGEQSPIGTTKERTAKGVYFTHVGLARTAMQGEFGETWKAHSRARLAAMPYKAPVPV